MRARTLALTHMMRARQYNAAAQKVDKLEPRALARDVHSCSVLVGATTAHLANLLFLARPSSVIQILPYNAQLESDTGLASLRALAQAAGHSYFEWAPAEAALAQVRWGPGCAAVSAHAPVHMSASACMSTRKMRWGACDQD